jgi:phage terminase small subunit
MTDTKRTKAAGKPKRQRPKTARTTAELTPLEERFVHEYFLDPASATAAYQRAGYKGKGDAARAAASRLLKRARVKAAIGVLREKEARRFDVSRERVLEQYARLAFSDIRRFHTPDGAFRSIVDLSEADAAAIEQVEIDEEYEDVDPKVELEPQPHGGGLKRAHAQRAATGRAVKLKLTSKRAALDSIVKLMGWAKEDKPPLGSEENPIRMIIEDLQGRKSAFAPVADISDDEDDD